MTRERVRTQQALTPGKPVTLMLVTVTATSPLTVQLPGGTTVTGRAIKGITYTIGDPAYALVQEPAVGPIIPIL